VSDQVDAVFYSRLTKLLRIVIPSYTSTEAGLLVLHSAFLVFRTLLSLYVAGTSNFAKRPVRMQTYTADVKCAGPDLDGKIVSALVRAQPGAFLLNLARWVLVAVPATYTNSMLVRPSPCAGLAY
jgi:ATP-binding cassette subfamily D (ALD) long-chain fatty acid import protein